MRFHPIGEGPKTTKTDKKHGSRQDRIPYRIDRRLTGLAGPEYHAIISFGLPFEPEDSQYGKHRVEWLHSDSHLARTPWSAEEGPPGRLGRSADGLGSRLAPFV